jgi:ABC-type multidrug transport system ATPase subunit
VFDEYKNANQAYPEDYEILTQNLRKVFMIDGKKSYKDASDNMFFGVKRGEVFGWLGANGAENSTTFKMLSGEIASISGDSYFCGLKISDNLDKIR